MIKKLAIAVLSATFALAAVAAEQNMNAINADATAPTAHVKKHHKAMKKHHHKAIKKHHKAVH